MECCTKIELTNLVIRHKKSYKVVKDCEILFACMEKWRNRVRRSSRDFSHSPDIQFEEMPMGYTSSVLMVGTATLQDTTLYLADHSRMNNPSVLRITFLWKFSHGGEFPQKSEVNYGNPLTGEDSHNSLLSTQTDYSFSGTPTHYTNKKNIFFFFSLAHSTFQQLPDA